VCAAFPAIAAIGDGYDTYVAVDASGTFNQTKHETGLLRMQAAGVADRLRDPAGRDPQGQQPSGRRGVVRHTRHAVRNPHLATDQRGGKVCRLKS
jgi:hypothetical protein